MSKVAVRPVSPIRVQAGKYESLGTSSSLRAGVDVSAHPQAASVTVRSGKSPSFVLVLVKTFGVRFMYSVVLKYASDILTFASPLILK